MDIKALTPNLSVSPQILASELQAVADAGFKALICNRPDGEGVDQPSFHEIAQAAARLNHEGIVTVYEVGQAGGRHFVWGLWMVGDTCRGLSVRGDTSPITGNLSRFVPHRMA